MNAISKSAIISGQFLLCFLGVLLTAFFGWEFFFRYRLIYNEMGRHFDEENAVVYHEQTVPFYGLFFVICLIAFASMCRWAFKTVRGQKSNN